MIVVCVASGTSVDGCDVAAVELDWDGETIVMRVLGFAEEPFPDGLPAKVLAMLPPGRTEIEDVCRLDNDLGRALADIAEHGVRELAGGYADLIVSPGQTVFHDVVGRECRGTLQVGQPAWIAERTGVPVVSDLRASDVAAGGHGAPLASTFDTYWLAGIDAAERLGALNLGGIANASVFDPGIGLIASFDTGPANCLLDLAAAEVTRGREGFDVDGRLALAGEVDERLLQRLLTDPYFALEPPKSTGRELFSGAYLAEARAGGDTTGPDLLATLTEFTARTVADALRPYDLAELVISGGGARNSAIVRALGRRMDPTRVRDSADYGVDAGAKESLLWSLLGFLTWHGVPGTVRAGDQVSTGASHRRVLGRITPGADGLRLPPPRSAPADALRVRPWPSGDRSGRLTAP